MTDTVDASGTLITLTADIVSAHVSNNSVAVSDLPLLIGNVHAALTGLGHSTPAQDEPAVPAVSIRSSVKPDYIVCLEDGKKFKMLKRHLMTTYQMTPEQYRTKWQLPKDYPMVAPNYAEMRRGLAKKIGLGRKAKAPPVAISKAKSAAADQPKLADAPAKPGRPRKTLHVAAAKTSS